MFQNSVSSTIGAFILSPKSKFRNWKSRISSEFLSRTFAKSLVLQQFTHSHFRLRFRTFWTSKIRKNNFRFTEETCWSLLLHIAMEHLGSSFGTVPGLGRTSNRVFRVLLCRNRGSYVFYEFPTINFQKCIHSNANGWFHDTNIDAFQKVDL